MLDKLKTQTDAAGLVTTFAYDLLGRPTQRSEQGLVSAWTYDTAAHGIGKPATASTNGNFARTHSYDALGRPASVATTIDAATYTVNRR